MEGIVRQHHLLQQPQPNSPRSLTYKRGVKRAADSDEAQRVSDTSHLSLGQPRVITGMLAFIPQSLWDYGSNLVYGLIDLVSSRHAPPAQQQAAQQHAATSQPTQITSVATDHSDRKRRAVDTSPVNVSRSHNAPTHTSPTARRVLRPMGLNIRRRVPGTSATAPAAAPAAYDRKSFNEMVRREDYRAYHDTTLTDLVKKIALSKAQKSTATTQPTAVEKKVPFKDRQIDGLIHKALKAQGTTTAQRASQKKKAAEEQAAAEKQAAEVAAAQEAARLELEKEKALIAAEKEQQRIVAEEERQWHAHIAEVEQQHAIEREEERIRKLENEPVRLAQVKKRREQTVSDVGGALHMEIEDKVTLSKLRDRDTVIQSGSIPLQLITFKRIMTFGSKGTDSWLDDDAVNAWFNLIVETKKQQTSYVKSDTNPPAFANLQTAWYAKFTKEKAKGLKRWMKRAGIGGANMLKCERIFLPINSGAHWTLLIINGVDRSMEYLDSLGGDGGRYFQIARELLKSELGDKYHEKEWTELKRNRSSPQDNMNDCGVFACMNGLAAAKGRPYKDVTAKLMDEARTMMAGVLLNCDDGFNGVVEW